MCVCVLSVLTGMLFCSLQYLVKIRLSATTLLFCCNSLSHCTENL